MAPTMSQQWGSSALFKPSTVGGFLQTPFGVGGAGPNLYVKMYNPSFPFNCKVSIPIRCSSREPAKQLVQRGMTESISEQAKPDFGGLIFLPVWGLPLALH